MKKRMSVGVAAHTSFLLVVFFMLITIGRSLRVWPPHVPLNLQREVAAGNRENLYRSEEGDEERGKEEERKDLYQSGSRLPDCSHACGPCFPCKRVMVSFKCSTSESCPIVYRCMCKGKYYHVPSN
ncbi:hypothetical protein C1H46_041224 [Malus baccata]|uniref:Epidermal patterning factor-like protein n=1 Tax=Malus baccata TaxID=106549 RepID=A0A540KG84_MALBA|nr:hypothetical protein C1H46_041224 [Malus baccata]